MANKHTKGYSTSLGIREMPIKTTVRLFSWCLLDDQLCQDEAEDLLHRHPISETHSILTSYFMGRTAPQK